MMRGVQEATPENPDSFALHVEERYDCKPPFFVLLCEEVQAWTRELNHSCGKRLRSSGLRQYFVCRHFGQAEELAKETALGEDFVLHDLANRCRTRMWFEREIVFGEFVPDGIKLVYLTRVGLQQVLKNPTRSKRNVGVFDS